MTTDVHPRWATLNQPTHPKAARLGTSKGDADLVRTFSVALRSARDERGISQYRLASLTGLDHSVIGRYEKGTRFPTRETAQALADVLGDEVMIAAGFLPDGYTAVKIAS